MALPFDLRAFASRDDADGAPPGRFGPRGVGRARERQGDARPSRAIVVPPSIVDGVRAHDVEAFRELVRLTYAPLVRFAQTILGSRDEAEDVVQDVFTVIWDRGPRWNPSGETSAYLFASVRNHALKELRRRGRAERRAERAAADGRLDGAALGGDGSASALDDVIDAETDAACLRALGVVLAMLTERQRTAYELRYHQGLTVPKIAEVLGISAKGAEQLVRRVTQLVIARVKEEVGASR